MSAAPTLTTNLTNGRARMYAAGSWTAAQVSALEPAVETATRAVSGARTLQLDLSAVDEIDTIGAWLLERMIRRVRQAGSEIETVGIRDRFTGLMEELRSVNRHSPAREKQNPVLLKLDQIGQSTVSSLQELLVFLDMLGRLGDVLARLALKPARLRLTSTIYQLHKVGWQAVPIIVLITFLIGAIIAQQGIFHFRKFGADAYVVDMVGILVLREIGVLIVAIMVAGRSGSAYTAELGSMKMREEIDALTTMGLDPLEVLVLPRVIALMIALPILTFIGSIAALYGGGLIAWLYGGMSPAIFIARLHEAVSVTHFEVGLIKAPFMALVIGVVASSEGLRVKGSAESLGRQTTTSVVKSIFLVIVLDGLFAVFFASIGM
ncbi:putative phospholipid ABC transporter permease protein mlaE OS=Afipia felis OX=1035 GN=mlaE_2 PE=3 SV=1 [Afipia felis]